MYVEVLVVVILALFSENYTEIDHLLEKLKEEVVARLVCRVDQIWQICVASLRVVAFGQKAFNAAPGSGMS